MRFFIAVFSILILIMPAAQAHQEDGDGGETPNGVQITELSSSLFVIQAGGGNIAIFSGDDGVFVIDNGLADKRDAVEGVLHQIVTDKPVKYMVNTHWHFDHAGNNKIFGENKKTILLAHKNVRTRLKNGGVVKAFDTKIEPADKDALPTLTYEDGINVYLNDQEIEIKSLGPAHTDGDSFIVFKNQNIVHTGDIFFNGLFPFIDASSGGNVKGMIDAIDVILKDVNSATKIIPGHGPVASEGDFRAYQDMLKTVHTRLMAAKAEGKAREEWQESRPLADLNDVWGGGFLNTDKFTTIVWDAL